ncbi:phospholipase D-like domain-containing protein, partial [Thiolapillus sp.]
MKFLTLLLLLILSGCAVLPENIDKRITTAYKGGQNRLLNNLYASAPKQGEDTSGFMLLGDGLDAFVARAVLAQIAEHGIDTQYYMIHDDDVGNLFIDQLLQAANRGVRVRLLLDDINEGGRDFNIMLFDAHPNIQVRIFNPFGRNVGRIWQYITGFGWQTRRAHNKSFTVDGQATILGGRNIGDEYFGHDPALELQDLDVLAIGPVADEVSDAFDAYWNHELSYPISLLVDAQYSADDLERQNQRFSSKVARLEKSPYIDRLRHSHLVEQMKRADVQLEWGKGKVYVDPPDKLLRKVGDRSSQMFVELLPYLLAAKKEVVIFSPYFVPGKEGVALLKQLREKGVRVAILTNSLSSTDVSIVHAGYSRYRKALLRAGVELWELNKVTSKEERKARKEGRIGSSKSSLHAKAFVVDRKTVFVGSLNLDPRSVSQNTEIGVVFRTPGLATRIADSFDRNIADAAFRLELKQDEYGSEYLLWHGRVDGEQTTLKHEPYTGFFKRLGIGLMRW